MIKILDALYYYPNTITPNCSKQRNWLEYKKVNKFKNYLERRRMEDKMICSVASETHNSWSEARRSLQDFRWNRQITAGLHYVEKYPPKEIKIYDWASYDKCKISKKSCSCGMMDSLSDKYKYKQSAHWNGKVDFADVRIYMPDIFLFGFPIRWNFRWVITVNVEKVREDDIADGHGKDDYDVYEIFVKRSWLTIDIVAKETKKWMDKHFPNLKNTPVKFISTKEYDRLCYAARIERKL